MKLRKSKRKSKMAESEGWEELHWKRKKPRQARRKLSLSTKLQGQDRNKEDLGAVPLTLSARAEGLDKSKEASGGDGNYVESACNLEDHQENHQADRASVEAAPDQRIAESACHPKTGRFKWKDRARNLPSRQSDSGPPLPSPLFHTVASAAQDHGRPSKQHAFRSVLPVVQPVLASTALAGPGLLPTGRDDRQGTYSTGSCGIGVISHRQAPFAVPELLAGAAGGSSGMRPPSLITGLQWQQSSLNVSHVPSAELDATCLAAPNGQRRENLSAPPEYGANTNTLQPRPLKASSATSGSLAHGTAGQSPCLASSNQAPIKDRATTKILQSSTVKAINGSLSCAITGQSPCLASSNQAPRKRLRKREVNSRVTPSEESQPSKILIRPTSEDSQPAFPNNAALNTPSFQNENCSQAGLAVRWLVPSISATEVQGNISVGNGAREGRHTSGATQGGSENASRRQRSTKNVARRNLQMEKRLARKTGHSMKPTNENSIEHLQELQGQVVHARNDKGSQKKQPFLRRQKDIMKRLKSWAAQAKILQGGVGGGGLKCITMSEVQREAFVQSMVESCQKDPKLRSSFLGSVNKIIECGLMHSAASKLLTQGPCKEGEGIMKAFVNFKSDESATKGLPIDLLDAVDQLHKQGSNLFENVSGAEDPKLCSLSQIEEGTWQIQLPGFVPQKESSVHPGEGLDM